MSIMPFRLLAALTAATLSMPATASYATHDSIQDSIHALDAVEVLGSAPEKATISTSPTFVIGSRATTTMGITDIGDALHRIPGVNVRDYGGAGGLKTVSVRGFGAQHTGVFYDGVALTDCQTGFIDLARFSPDNINTLEMVIGDNSDIFVSARAAASAATVSISTLSLPEPEDSALLLSARIKGGSFGNISPYVRIGKRLGRKFALGATADYSYGENDYPFTLHNGIETSRERRHNSRMNAAHAEADAAFNHSRYFNLAAKIYGYYNDRRLPGAVTLYNPVSNEKLRERNAFAQLRANGQASEVLRWSATAKFNWASSVYGDTGSRYPGGELREAYCQREAYMAGAVIYEPSRAWAFDYSADYAFNNLSTNKNQPQPRRHSILQSATARFRGGPLLITGRLLLSIYRNSAKNGEAAADATRLSPSLSLSLRPWSRRLFFLRASYKNIFRMPTFADSYYATTGSPTLRPETTDQFNIGFTWQPRAIKHAPLLVFTADAYYNRVRDRIVALPRNMFIWSMVNVGKVRAFGIDLSLNASIVLARGHSLLPSSNYSWQKVQSRTSAADPDYNKQVAYTPVHSGAASLAYENPWVNIVVHLTATSERYGTNSNLPESRIAGYTDCGAALYRTFALGRHNMEVRADILNIFNKQYELVARYPMPGRAWQLSLTFNL